MRPERFHVLFVCTANICRSPMAAELARLRLGAAARSGDILVSSAGTHGHDGADMDPDAAAVLRSLGGETAGFSARTVTVPLLSSADLVLTAERGHRAAVAALHPSAHARMFTILEFARLIRRISPDRLAGEDIAARARSLVREAARMRGMSPPGPPDEDIADPYQGPAEDYRACATTIQVALDLPLRRILSGPP
ncbi:protein-tyrosine-phosphatase [Actinoallomurus acanthiterrae]